MDLDGTFDESAVFGPRNVGVKKSFSESITILDATPTFLERARLGAPAAILPDLRLDATTTFLERTRLLAPATILSEPRAEQHGQLEEQQAEANYFAGNMSVQGSFRRGGSDSQRSHHRAPIKAPSRLADLTPGHEWGQDVHVTPSPLAFNPDATISGSFSRRAPPRRAIDLSHIQDPAAPSVLRSQSANLYDSTHEWQRGNLSFSRGPVSDGCMLPTIARQGSGQVRFAKSMSGNISGTGRASRAFSEVSVHSSGSRMPLPEERGPLSQDGRARMERHPVSADLSSADLSSGPRSPAPPSAPAPLASTSRRPIRRAATEANLTHRIAAMQTAGPAPPEPEAESKADSGDAPTHRKSPISFVLGKDGSLTWFNREQTEEIPDASASRPTSLAAAAVAGSRSPMASRRMHYNLMNGGLLPTRQALQLPDDQTAQMTTWPQAEPRSQNRVRSFITESSLLGARSTRAYDQSLYEMESMIGSMDNAGLLPTRRALQMLDDQMAQMTAWPQAEPRSQTAHGRVRRVSTEVNLGARGAGT